MFPLQSLFFNESQSLGGKMFHLQPDCDLLCSSASITPLTLDVNVTATVWPLYLALSFTVPSTPSTNGSCRLELMW